VTIARGTLLGLANSFLRRCDVGHTMRSAGAGVRVRPNSRKLTVRGRRRLSSAPFSSVLALVAELGSAPFMPPRDFDAPPTGSRARSRAREGPLGRALSRTSGEATSSPFSGRVCCTGR
jgi:hypothetical protein